MSAALRAPSPVLFFPQKQAARPRLRQLRVVSDYAPAGDQPAAIAALTAGILGGERARFSLSRLRERAGVRGSPHSTEKLVPQPQDELAFGLRTAKWLPISSSV